MKLSYIYATLGGGSVVVAVVLTICGKLDTAPLWLIVGLLSLIVSNLIEIQATQIRLAEKKRIEDTHARFRR